MARNMKGVTHGQRASFPTAPHRIHGGPTNRRASLRDEKKRGLDPGSFLKPNEKFKVIVQEAQQVF